MAQRFMLSQNAGIRNTKQSSETKTSTN